MSSAGLQVFSANGSSVQVTQNYRNLVYIGDYTLNPDANFNAYIDIAAESPAIVVKYSPIAAGDTFRKVVEISRQKISSTTWRVNLKVTSAGIVVAVYGLYEYQKTSGFGLQVFKEDGSVAFDSTFPYMRVLDKIDVPEYTGSSAGSYRDSYTVNLPSSDCGVLVSQTSRFGLRGIGRAEIEQLFMEGVGVNNGRAQVGWALLGETDWPPSYSYWNFYGGQPPVLIFVDLSKNYYNG